MYVPSDFTLKYLQLAHVTRTIRNVPINIRYFPVLVLVLVLVLLVILTETHCFPLVKIHYLIFP